MGWKHPGSPRTRKIKVVSSVDMVTATVFLDYKDDVMLVDFLGM